MAAASPPPPPHNNASLRSSHSLDTNYAQTDEFNFLDTNDDSRLSTTNQRAREDKGKGRGVRRVRTVGACTPASKWRREPLRDISNHFSSVGGRSPPRLRRVNTISEMEGSDPATPSRESPSQAGRQHSNSISTNVQGPRRRLRRSHTTPSPYPSPYATSALVGSTNLEGGQLSNGVTSSPTTRQGTVLSSGGSLSSACVELRRGEREADAGSMDVEMESPNSRTIRMHRRRGLPITPPATQSLRSRPPHEVQQQEDTRLSSPSPPNVVVANGIRRTRSSVPTARRRESRDASARVGEDITEELGREESEEGDGGRALRRRRTSGGFR